MVSIYEVPHTPATVVISQDPDVGAIVHAGDTILLFVA